MNTIPENMLLAIASPWEVNKKTETTFQGYRIVVQQFGDTYDYEILAEGYRRNEWHVWHSDTDFETEEQARQEAESYIDNWEPSDNYYAQ